MYHLKKFVGFFVTPLIFCTSVQLVGFWFIWRKQLKLGWGLCILGISLLMVLSMPLVGEGLMAPLEATPHPEKNLTQPELNPDVGFVVVLSGGFHTAQQYSAASRLAPDSLRRLLEGIALARQLPQARLVLSGGHLDDEKPAVVMGQLARDLGWPSDRTLLETKGKTTEEQAIKIKDIVGEEPFYLVTSSNHIPRAMFHFRAAKTQPIPYPCDHIIQNPTIGLRSIVPSIYGLALSNAALHEYVGRLYGFLF